MERQTLNIEKVEKKVTDKDQIWLRVKASGSWYSCWKPDLYTQLLEGRTVEVGIEENIQGDKTFHNIMQVYAVGPSSENPPRQSQLSSKPSDPVSETNGSQGQGQPDQEYWVTRNKSIEWQGCLHGAASFLAGVASGMDTTPTSKDLVAVTKYLYDELQKHKAGG